MCFVTFEETILGSDNTRWGTDTQYKQKIHTVTSDHLTALQN